MTQAYPLHWPPGFPRNKSRSASRFKTSLNGAVRNVQEELRRFGNDSGKMVKGVVISSNVTLMDQRPADPGVACYFQWDGLDVCIPVDRYRWPEENLQAVARILDAERAKIRHGGLNIVRASFRGWAALPPPKPSAGELPKPWRDVLGVDVDADLAEVEKRYRGLVKKKHPDKGGTPAAFNEVVDAMRQAREELRA